MKTHKQYIEEQTQADPTFADDIAEADALTTAHARIAELEEALRDVIADPIHISEGPWHEWYCVFCDADEKDNNGKDSIVHEDNCVLVRARAVLAATPRTEGEP